MGIGISKKKSLTNEEIEKYANNNKTLEKYYNYHRNYDGYITLKDFEYCFNKIIDKRIIKILFKIFASEKDKLVLEDMKYFYCVFQVNNFVVKLNLIASLIFKNKSAKLYPKYVDRVNLLFKSTPLRDKLLSTDFIVKISDIARGMPTKIFRDLFEKQFELQYRQFLEQFQFLRPNYMSSITPFKIGAANVSVCDCFSLPTVHKDSATDRLLDNIEIEFKRIEKLNDGIFHLSLLEKILNELGIDEKIVELIILYLRRKAQRNFLDFKTFKVFLMSFTQDTEEIIKFFFDVLTYPSDLIEKEIFVFIIYSILDPNNTSINVKNQLDSYFVNNSVINFNTFRTFLKNYTTINEIMNKLERLNYIPYIYFKLRPENTHIEKKCIDLIMKGEKDLKKYIEKIMTNEEEFFCLDMNFWNSWSHYVNWDIAKTPINESEIKELNLNNYDANFFIKRPKINTENLTCDYNNKLKLDCVYFKDFVIVPKRMYDLFTRWYMSSGCEMKFKKISYPVKFNDSHTELPPNKVQSPLRVIVLNIVHEIELFPVFSKFFSYEELLSNVTKPKTDLVNNLINSLNENKKLNISRINAYSRKTQFDQIKSNLDTYYKVKSNQTRLWVYTQEKKLILPDLKNTLEEEGISGFCLFILDMMKNNQWLSESINTNGDTETRQDGHKEPVCDSLFKKTQNNNRIIGFHNIGNTCYMNSTLQSLLNIKELTDIFKSKNSKFLVNYSNNLGFKGKVFREFLQLLEEKLSNEMIDDGNPIKPSAFKEIIGQINSQFANYEQQDAQEFINFLLDILHEEMNIKDTKEYIKNPETFDYNEQELANEYWANNLRRNVSFIHSLFLGQLKSNLICGQCDTKKITYETFTNLNLPITQKRTINLQIILHRLPMAMKAYYNDFLNESYNKHNEYSLENTLPGEKYISKSNIIKNNESGYGEFSKTIDMTVSETYQSMIAFSESRSKILNSSISHAKLNQSVYSKDLSTSIPLKINIELENKSKLEQIIEELRKMKELELEGVNKNKFYYSTFVISAPYDPLFYDLELKIDECFQNNQTLFVYELINTNGINKLAYSGNIDSNDELTHIKQMNNSNYNNVLLELSYETLSNFNKPTILENTLLNSAELKREYLIQINHRYTSEASDFYLFRNTNTIRLDFHLAYILVNNDNTKNFSGRFLYDYVWEKYEYLFNNPSKMRKLLWWQDMAVKVNSVTLREIKYCTPFVIKILNKDNNTCINCPWLKFCTGCILDPFNKENIIILPSQVIVVEWCHNVIKNEINESNLKLVLNHKNVKIKEEEKSIKTLNECVNLFLEKEYLEGRDQQIYCCTCKSLQNFYKKYDIDRLPPVLILTLKRFKFAKMYKNKIDSLIDFPIHDLEIKGVKYNLNSVINHLGNLQSGHYTSIVKVNDKWIRCDDARCNEINESGIVSSQAYILVYKAKEEINSDYFKMMTYIQNNLDLKILNESTITEYIDHSRNIFTPCEPVMTYYGRGYVVKEIFREGIKLVEVKFRFGSAVLK